MQVPLVLLNRLTYMHFGLMETGAQITYLTPLTLTFNYE